MSHSSTNKRRRIYISQDGVCYYCGRKTVFEYFTIDHLNPKCRGGSNKNDNIVGCCDNCNRSKGNMNLVEFVETNYLKEDRRIALGATGRPTINFKVACRKHEERLPKLTIWQRFKKHYGKWAGQKYWQWFWYIRKRGRTVKNYLKDCGKPLHKRNFPRWQRSALYSGYEEAKIDGRLHTRPVNK
jgi:hypothetical protein